MDSELLIIFPGIILMLIIIGLSVNGIISKVLNHRREVRAIEHPATSGTNSALTERTAMIEDRLAVLERIATDRSIELVDEIEALRIETNAEEKIA
ncbi:MAG: hypothetical protein ABJP70_06985 [Erythrobacter sp.]